MKAYRNIAGEVREIEVDIGLDGTPILPPDTTVDPRPEPMAGHYVTVVDNAWVQIEIPVYVESFESKKAKVLAQIAAYRAWYLDQPVEVGGVKYDADEMARTRLTQALVMFTEMAYLPPVWIAFDNSEVAIADIAALKTIVGGVQTAFSTRFYECATLRGQVLTAATEEALAAVVVPTVPTGL